MGITLDGIAKGYIVDAIARVLEMYGVKRYLINAGGDIRAAGKKEKKQPWTVAVKDPSGERSFPDTIHLSDAAVATSGSYEIYFDRDKLFHHLVDSKTGRSPDMSSSVSVLAPSTMAADALATTVFVMDPPRAVQFIDSLSGCECLIIDNHGSQLKSSGWTSAAPINEAEAVP
jgi:thiamine biosynthesis lipoprotein